MKAIILAGGTGTRLRSIVHDMPKPMAPVSGKPFLEYLIMQLNKWGIRDIIFSIGYKGEIIKLYFGQGEKWGKHILYSEEKFPLGTGGALRKAFKLTDDDHIILMNGDSFLDINFDDMLASHMKMKALCTMGLVRKRDSGRYGRVEMNENGKIVGFEEKNPGLKETKGLINGGIYIFHREVIELIPDGNISLENTILPKLIKKGLFGIRTDGFFKDIGIPKDYKELCCHPHALELLKS